MTVWVRNQIYAGRSTPRRVGFVSVPGAPKYVAGGCLPSAASRARPRSCRSVRHHGAVRPGHGRATAAEEDRPAQERPAAAPRPSGAAGASSRRNATGIAEQREGKTQQPRRMPKSSRRQAKDQTGARRRLLRSQHEPGQSRPRKAPDMARLEGLRAALAPPAAKMLREFQSSGLAARRSPSTEAARRRFPTSASP